MQPQDNVIIPDENFTLAKKTKRSETTESILDSIFGMSLSGTSYLKVETPSNLNILSTTSETGSVWTRWEVMGLSHQDFFLPNINLLWRSSTQALTKHSLSDLMRQGATEVELLNQI